MKNLFKLFNFCFLFFAYTFLNAQQLSNLFYENTLDIQFEIHHLSISHKIGSAISGDLYLLNKQNVITDTLHSDKIIQNLFVLNENLVSVSFLKETMLVGILNNKFIILDSFEYDHSYGIPFFSIIPEGLLGFIPKRNTIEKIWFIPKKENNYDWDSKKEILLSDKNGLYKGKKKIKYVGDDNLPHRIFYLDKSILINKQASNLAFIISFPSCKLRQINLPAIDNKKESNYLYFDKAKQKFYNVKYRKNKSAQIYQYDLKTNKFDWLTKTNVLVKDIFDNNIYYTIGNAHYYKKLYPVNED